MLVLIALAIGLLMVATFLDGRQESAPVADRISAASMARRTAESGLDLAVASLLRSDDWRAALTNGAFDGSFEIADGNCKVRMTDANTNQAPNDATLRLLVACTANVDGLAIVAEQTVDVGPAEQPLNLGFGETALIATQRIRVRNDAALLSWAPRALYTEFSAPLVVGTLDGDATGFELGDAAVAAGLEVLMVDSRRFDSEVELPGARLLPGPLPQLDAPRVPSATDGRIEAGLELDSAPRMDIDAASLRIGSNASITINEDRVLHSRGDFQIDPGATIDVARGTLVITGDEHVTIHRASITAAPGARVLIRGGKSLRITDSTLGPEGATVGSLSADGMLPTDTDVTGVLVTGDQYSTIIIDGESMVTGVIVAPEAEVRVMGDALVHGRMVAERIELGDRCIVFAMPDDGRIVGLTSRVGPHRTIEGGLVPAVCRPDRLDPIVVLQIASELGVPAIGLEEVTYPPEAEKGRKWRHPQLVRFHRRWRMARGNDR